MIRVKDILKKNNLYKITYCEETKTLYIEDNSDDNLTPHRSATDCLFWLNEDNAMSEIECIFPVKRENNLFSCNPNIKTVSGIPVLEITRSQKLTEIYWDDTTLAIVFESEKKPDKIIKSTNLLYYLNHEEIIGIVCKDFKIVTPGDGFVVS